MSLLQDPAIDYTDVGGAFIGPTQNRIIRLAKELGVDNHIINEKEKSLFVPSFNVSILPNTLRCVDHLMKDILLYLSNITGEKNGVLKYFTACRQL